MRAVRPPSASSPTALASTCTPGARATGSTLGAHREVTKRFMDAVVGGDLELLRVLAPDVTLWTDGGGKGR